MDALATTGRKAKNSEGIGREQRQLVELIDAHEQIDWADVPTVEVAEASAWVARLIKAHEHMEGER